MKFRIKKICPYVDSRLPFINSKPVYLEDMRLLAATPFSGTGRDKFLFLTDVDRLTDKRYRMPDGETGGYGFARGADGNLYMGMFSGMIYSFNLQKRVFKQVARPFNKGQLIWGGGASSKGKIYMGVYPTGEFCELDISTGRYEIYKTLFEERVSIYARQFAEMPDGRVLIGVTGGSKTALLVFNPENSRVDKIGEWRPEGMYPATKYYISLECFLDEKRFLISRGNKILVFNWEKNSFEKDYVSGLPVSLSKIVKTSFGVYCIDSEGIFYELSGGRLKKIRERDAEGSRLIYIQYLGDKDFIGLSDTGIFVRFNLSGRKTSSFQAHNKSRYGLQIQFVKRVPDTRILVGSHFINMQMFTVNIDRKRSLPSLHKISQHVGQVNCGTFLKGRFYACSYTRAVLHEMNPLKPFVYGENPHVIAESGHCQNRPVSAVNDGRYLYMATKADYTRLGGAIVVYDTRSKTMKVYRNFVRFQNPVSLFYHKGTRSLVGATTIDADCRTCVPIARQAVIFIWDTVKRETVFKTSPWDAPAFYTPGFSEEGILIGFDAERYFLFDVNRRTTEVFDWKYGPVNSGAFLTESRFLCASEEAVFILNIKTGMVDNVSKTKGVAIAERFSDRSALVIKDRYSIGLLTV